MGVCPPKMKKKIFKKGHTMTEPPRNRPISCTHFLSNRLPFRPQIVMRPIHVLFKRIKEQNLERQILKFALCFLYIACVTLNYKFALHSILLKVCVLCQ